MKSAGSGRTVLVLGSYPPSLILFRGKLIEALVGRGHRVLAVASGISETVAGQLRELGAEPFSIHLPNQSMNPLGALRGIKALAVLFRRERVDAVIAYTIKPIVLGAIAARFAGVRDFVPMITGLGFALIEGRGAKRRLARSAASFLYRHALARSRVAIFQNPDDRLHFEKAGLLSKGLPTLIVGGSGIDLEDFQAKPLPEGANFLMISRLLGDKGVREYMGAAVQVKVSHPSARFRLVGYFDDSPDALKPDELDSAIAGGVEYLGRMDDVRHALENASIYVLPSYHEGTPRSVLEAMAMGRAIITTDAPGCRQTVEPGVNGLLVSPRSTAAVAEAMTALIQAPERVRAMGEQSRRLAVAKFDVRQVNAAIIAAAGL